MNRTKETGYTTEDLTEIGGTRWQKGDKDRIYFNNWTAFAGLETTHYKSGGIAAATYRGEPISNTQAGKISGCIEKIYWDVTEEKWQVLWGWDHPKIGRDRVWNDFLTGVRRAIERLGGPRPHRELTVTRCPEFASSSSRTAAARHRPATGDAAADAAPRKQSPMSPNDSPHIELAYPTGRDARRAACEEAERLRQERQAAIRALPVEERKRRRAESQVRAEAARAQVLEHLVLPELSGSEKQIAWASGIRARCIHAALEHTIGRRDGAITYALTGAMLDDPLRMRDIPHADPPGGLYETWEMLLAGVTAAVSHHGPYGDRTRADWWIDQQYYA